MIKEIERPKWLKNSKLFNGCIIIDNDKFYYNEISKQYFIFNKEVIKSKRAFTFHTIYFNNLGKIDRDDGYATFSLLAKSFVINDIHFTNG